MDISLQISPAPSITNRIAVVIFRSDNPNVAVSFRQFDPPHLTPQMVNFDGVDAVTFIVNTYATPGWPTVGQLLHSFMYQPSFRTAEIKPTEYLTMAEGGTGYTDATWDGWAFKMERVGAGTQFPDIDITVRNDGFDLLNPGDMFSDNEKWVATFDPKITLVNPSIESPKVIRAERIIEENEVLTEDDSNIGLRLQGNAVPAFTVTLPALNTLDAFKQWFFFSEGGQHLNVIIQSASGDTFRKYGNRIILGQGEYLQLYNAADGWQVISVSPGVLQVGEIIQRYRNADPNNWLFTDGNLYLRSVYPRLWDELQNTPGALISDSTWLSDRQNEGRFSSGDGLTNFRVPRLYTTQFTRALNPGTEAVGSYLINQVGELTISLPKGDSYNGNPYDTNIFGRGNTLRGNNNFTLNAGQKTRPESFGVYYLIRS